MGVVIQAARGKHEIRRALGSTVHSKISITALGKQRKPAIHRLLGRLPAARVRTHSAPLSIKMHESKPKLQIGRNGILIKVIICAETEQGAFELACTSPLMPDRWIQNCGAARLTHDNV